MGRLRPPSPRAALAAARGSLAVRCIACLFVYALALWAMMAGLGAASDAVFEDAFPSMWEVLDRRDALLRDDFGALATRRLSRCHIAVFDGEGRRLYASSEEAAGLRASELALMEDFGESSFYEVFREGDGRHRVMRCSYGSGDDATKVVEAWCVLDESLRVAEGDLFAERGSLTPREFDLIKGAYDARMNVSRWDYETEDGSPRTLAFASPLVTEAGYARVADDVARLWLLAAPGALVATALCAAAVAWQVRRAALPLGRAIAACREGAADAPAPLAPAAEVGVPVELVPVYEGLSDLMGRLRAARDDRQRLVADVSHDLKTPLTVVRGFSQALCEGRVPEGREAAYLRAIHEKSLVAAGLLDTLCAYARMEHPEHRPRLVSGDVPALVLAAAEESLPQVERAGCRLEVDVAPAEGCRALVEPGLFRRMLLNLVENACAHNPGGTRVRVACRPARARDGARLVAISVADTGAGFAPDVAARAFEPFVTGDEARPSGGGSGLGLAVVRRAAELMGGSVRIEAEPAAPWGAELVVELPLAPDGEPPSVPADPPEPADAT